MKTDDGREVLVTLALPLPLPLATDLMRAVGDAAKRAGYTDAAIMTDGTGRIVATPPGAKLRKAQRAGTGQRAEGSR